MKPKTNLTQKKKPKLKQVSPRSTESSETNYEEGKKKATTLPDHLWVIWDENEVNSIYRELSPGVLDLYSCIQKRTNAYLRLYVRADVVIDPDTQSYTYELPPFTQEKK